MKEVDEERIQCSSRSVGVLVVRHVVNEEVVDVGKEIVVGVGGMTPGYTKVHDSTKEEEKQTTKIKQAAGWRLQAARPAGTPGSPSG